MSSTSIGVDGATTLSLTSTEVFLPCAEVMVELTGKSFTRKRRSAGVGGNSQLLKVNVVADVARLVKVIFVEASNRSGLTSQPLIKFEMVIKR